jgi:hypothetical protein
MSLLDEINGGSVTATWIREHLDYPHKDWCLFWPFALNQGGYANFGGKHLIVSRIMCEYRNGPAPADKPDAAHECGKGHEGCLNPWHLVWKSRGDNLRDIAKHGRRPKRYKVTPEQVDEIRALEGRMRPRDIAEMYGITDNNVHQILKGKIWKQANSTLRIFTEEEVRLIRSTPWQVKSAKQFAAELGCTRGQVDRIKQGASYKWVDCPRAPYEKQKSKAQLAAEALAPVPRHQPGEQA